MLNQELLAGAEMPSPAEVIKTKNIESIVGTIGTVESISLTGLAPLFEVDERGLSQLTPDTVQALEALEANRLRTIIEQCSNHSVRATAVAETITYPLTDQEVSESQSLRVLPPAESLSPAEIFIKEVAGSTFSTTALAAMFAGKSTTELLPESVITLNKTTLLALVPQLETFAQYMQILSDQAIELETQRRQPPIAEAALKKTA